MIKKILTIFVLILWNLYAFAKTDCIVLCDKENKETIIPIKDATEISFDGNLMLVGKDMYSMNLLKKYYFADSENLGVQEISDPIRGLKIDPKGLIYFDEKESKGVIEVYNIQGISQFFIHSGNVIDIRNLQPDVYVVKIGNASIKFVKQ